MVAAAVAVSFLLLALWTPLMQDDLVFMAQSADFGGAAPGEAPGFSWSAWAGHCRLMYAENNGRLANILAPLGAWLLPQWGRALLTGLCAAWILWIAARMASGRGGDWRAMLAMWALSLVAWPWRDRLMFWDYALNYLFASALLLPFLSLYCKRHPSGWQVAAGAACGFFGAWMHDGSALCMVAAVGALAILRRVRLSKARWVMAAALLLGTVVVLSSPGEWQRASGEVGSGSLVGNLFTSLRIEPLVWVLAAVSVVAVCRIGRVPRDWYGGDLLTACALMAFCSFGMSVLLDPSGRYGWQASVFASVVLFGLWRKAAVGVPGWFRTAATVAAALFAVVVMTAAVSFQRRLWMENDAVMAEAGMSDTGTVFRDVLSAADEPLAAMRLPASGVWGNSFQMACANAIRDPRERMVAVVPACFREFSIDSLRPLEGDAGVGVWRGYIVGTDTVTPFDVPGFLCGAQRTAVRRLVLTDESGADSETVFWLYKFRVPKSGGRAAVFYGPVSGEVRAASVRLQ